MALTPEQLTHLQGVLNTFHSRASMKYIAGAEEHGGNLWDKTPIQLVELAIDEAVDQVVYLVTLRQKLLGYL